MVSQPTPTQIHRRLDQLIRGMRLSLNETARLAESGLPHTAFTAVQSALGVSAARLGQLTGIPPATLARRKKTGFTAAESDRLLRYARTLNAALQTLGDGNDGAQATQEWLDEPALALEGRRPLDHCQTEAGAEEVRNLLGALEHGLYL